MRAGARAGEGMRGGGGGAARSRSGAARGHGRLAAAGLALSPVPRSLLRCGVSLAGPRHRPSLPAGWRSPRRAQHPGIVQASRPRATHRREKGGGGGRRGREGGSARAARRGHHVTRGRVTPRAPPCQRRPRPRGGEMAGLTPPARQSPAGLGRVLGSAVASLSRWVGSRVWTEPGGSAAPPLEGGRSSCGVVGVAGAACAGTAWLGSARLGSVRRVRGRAGHASGAGSCGALARERHPLPCSHLKIGGFLIPCNRVLQVAQSTR